MLIFVSSEAIVEACHVGLGHLLQTSYRGKKHALRARDPGNTSAHVTALILVK
jgi:hypothetical protein